MRAEAPDNLRLSLLNQGSTDIILHVLQDTGTSFKITPRKGGSTFTPSKLMLMNRERRMNMLSPDTRTKLFNTDIETGKIVNEWSFKKDGTDVEIKDIVNDTRAGQLTDEDTFLGIGQNR